MIASVGLMLSELPPSGHLTDVSTPPLDLDLALQGGIVARIGDTVFDGSVETQLQRLHRRLAGAPSAY